jgi:hypothetical protein
VKKPSQYIAAPAWRPQQEGLTKLPHLPGSTVARDTSFETVVKSWVQAASGLKIPLS